MKVVFLLALNNKLALYTLQVIHDLGKMIPGDVGFVCFDDHELFGFYNPEITAVSHSPALVGEKAVKLLLNEIKQPSTSKIKELIPAKLVIRGSSQKRN